MLKALFPVKKVFASQERENSYFIAIIPGWYCFDTRNEFARKLFSKVKELSKKTILCTLLFFVFYSLVENEKGIPKVKTCLFQAYFRCMPKITQKLLNFEKTVTIM
jgi:hypothetical protein